MKKTWKILLLLTIAILLMSFTSCRRSDITINQILVQPYMKQSGEMGLSLFLRTSLKTTENSSLRITDSSGSLSWTVPIEKVEYDKTEYYGCSDIAMPNGCLLPQGIWHMDLIYKDGRTISESFNVSYKNAETVLAKYPSISEPIYDADSNLTILK